MVIALAALVATAGAPGAVLSLRPRMADGGVVALEVALDLPEGPATLDLRAPVTYPGAAGAADRMTGITVRDRDGVVPLTVTDDDAAPGGFPYYRHWRAGRPVAYPLRLTYRAAVQPPGGANGPPFGLRAVDGGIAGAGSTLLMTPAASGARRMRLRWDLSAMPAGSIAATSLGDGIDVTVEGGLEALAQAWLMAGPAGRYPAHGADGGFSATWLGTPPYDAACEMARAARGHAWLARYFPPLGRRSSYRVFLQFREAPPFGGATALTRSFMLSRGPLLPGEPARPPQSTIFHEMIHQWVGDIAEPAGTGSWFTEGLTNYYQDVLQLRGGFLSIADYGAAINRLTQDYYTSKARDWPMSRIAAVGFADEEVRHTPYRRGAMYFHDLDARLREASGGRRTLDDLLFPLFRARLAGARFDSARWIAIVTQALGAGEGDRFRRVVLDGSETLGPRPGLFGPCFTPVAIRHPGAIDVWRWIRDERIPNRACAGSL